MNFKTGFIIAGSLGFVGTVYFAFYKVHAINAARSEQAYEAGQAWEAGRKARQDAAIEAARIEPKKDSYSPCMNCEMTYCKESILRLHIKKW